MAVMVPERKGPIILKYAGCLFGVQQAKLSQAGLLLIAGLCSDAQSEWVFLSRRQIDRVLSASAEPVSRDLYSKVPLDHTLKWQRRMKLSLQGLRCTM